MSSRSWSATSPASFWVQSAAPEITSLPGPPGFSTTVPGAAGTAGSWCGMSAYAMSGSQAPGGPPDLALAGSILCNDFPTLWDRRAPIPLRLRQYAARRAHLAQRSFRPFSARAWTSAIVDRGNTCIRWPDRHGPVQRTTGPFPHVPVLATSGDLDPNVPTAEGRQAARQFPHAQVVEVPNAGHAPEQEATGCAMSITTEFIRNQRLGDTSCLARIPPVPVG